VGLSLAVFWPAGVALIASALVAALAIGVYATRRLGGLTGDVFGAMIEVNEAALLLLVVTSVSRPWLT
jgi:adenosylcobinamide-GDP ribazoletransferase